MAPGRPTHEAAGIISVAWPRYDRRVPAIRILGLRIQVAFHSILSRPVVLKVVCHPCTMYEHVREAIRSNSMCVDKDPVRSVSNTFGVYQNASSVIQQLTSESMQKYLKSGPEVLPLGCLYLP